MKGVLNWATKNPLRAMAIVTAISAAAAPFLPAAVLAGVNGILAAVLGVGLHSVVTPVTTAVENTTKAVTEAVTETATKTVEALDETIVGSVGQVTDLGQAVVETVSRDVLGKVLGAVT